MNAEENIFFFLPWFRALHEFFQTKVRADKRSIEIKTDGLSQQVQVLWSSRVVVGFSLVVC